MNREQWLEKAIDQYSLHGISKEKGRMWAESLLNNGIATVESCPYLAAEKCYRS
jgi:hypothetical protein